MKLRSLTVVLAISLVPSLASAHAALSDPTPRSAEDGLTMEPCGGVAAGAPTMFMANETITVSWAVGQTHGGFLQIDFAAADDVFDDTMILATDIPDTEGNPTSMDVTLPDIACDACTLRLIQINRGKSNYVSCADVQLIGGGTSTGSSGSDSGASDGSTGSGSSESGGSSSGGPVDTTGGTDGSTSSPTSTASASTTAPTTDGGSESSGGSDEDDAGGCGCTSTGSPSSLALGLLALLALRRRRR